MALLERSTLIYKQAQRLLTESPLKAIVESYGRLHTTGSYALDLMTWHDLDLQLVPTFPLRYASKQELFAQLMKEVITNLDVRSTVGRLRKI